MTSTALLLLGIGTFLLLYPYLVYPPLLKLIGALRPAPPVADVASVRAWPTLSITVPVHDEEAQIGELLDSLLALDYPVAQRQILVVSDASRDGTERIVRAYASRGVELLRLEERRGKTVAENLARDRLTGEIVVNTDASVRVHPDALRHLVAAFADPAVGVASGRDVSMAADGSNAGESSYVGWEMGIRALENRVQGVVGVSGCLYAVRRELHRVAVPGGLPRDFFAALHARERGFRSVSVENALCFVPRTGSLLREYRRKVRTLTRGMQTLVHHRRLLNPLHGAVFAWMLASHKLVRWGAPWAALLAGAGLVLLLPHPAAASAMALGGAAAALGAAPWIAEWRGRAPRAPAPLLALPAYLLGGMMASVHALCRVLAGRTSPVWEPTRRERPALGSGVTSLPSRGA